MWVATEVAPAEAIASATVKSPGAVADRGVEAPSAEAVVASVEDPRAPAVRAGLRVSEVREVVAVALAAAVDDADESERSVCR
jgi:hypothetical protein